MDSLPLYSIYETKGNHYGKSICLCVRRTRCRAPQMCIRDSLNKAQTGSLKVVKTADDDKIEGRTFKISGTDFMGNAYEQEFKTDENGEINLTLRVGEYTVSEVAGEDSEKYILPDDQTVEIKAGETTTVKMHNKLVPEVPSVPQTGDNPWMPAILGTLAGLAVLSGGALLFLRYTGKKRKSADQTDEDQGTEE